MKTMIKSVRGALLAVAATAVATPVMAAGQAPHIERQQWSFSGPFGQYDKAQLQRGFKVYKEVCASCHGARLLSFRNLAEEGGPGFTEDQVKAVAAEYTVMKGPNDDGEMEEVAAIPSDRWPSPFPNEQAARAANGGAYPPDFSTLAKARAVASGFPGFVFDMFTQYQEHGPDYIYNLLTGYKDAPACFGEDFSGYYNEKFRRRSITNEECHGQPLTGGPIGMAPPLSDEQVEYNRRHADDRGPVRPRRLRLHDVGCRAEARGAQEHGLPRDDLPGRLRFAPLLHQEVDLARRRALSGPDESPEQVAAGAIRRPFHVRCPVGRARRGCYRSRHGRGVARMVKAVLGVIGGSGLYDLPALEGAEWVEVASPWGEASDAVRIGEIDGLKVVFLPRHGRGHRYAPSDINYRRQYRRDEALRRHLAGFGLAVGSLNEAMRRAFRAGRPVHRPQLRAGEELLRQGLRRHVSMAEPVSPGLVGHIAAAAEAEALTFHRGGTYLAMEGPQFSSLAESKLYRSWNCDVIGMTNMPEAKLAREAEICYATVAMVTDYDSWHPDHGSVDIQSIIKVLHDNADNAAGWWARLAQDLPREHEACPIGSDTALEFALMTAPEARDPELTAKLDAVAGRVLAR